MALRLARAAWHNRIQQNGTSGTFLHSRRSVASTTVGDDSTTTEIKQQEKPKSSEETRYELKPGELGAESGAPKEQLRRKVVIYSPARTASQQGRGECGKWLIEHNTTQQWENPLMGWTSSRDPYMSLSEQAMTFSSKEAAVEFARNQGWEFAVREPHQQTLKPKAYADNFKWKGLPVMGGDEA